MTTTMGRAGQALLLVVGSAVFLSAEEARHHWAFARLAPASVPRAREAAPARTAVDAFVLAKLAEQGLSFSPEAERATLLRRVYLDLVGLPPEPEEVDALLADARPDAYEELVERLLASPGFGERWARHWLDVVGYADAVGFDMNANSVILAEGKWRYRDYVIAALNTDKPYDAFIREQLAGDESVDWRGAETFSAAILEPLVATGFLRTAQDFSHEPISDIPTNHFEVLHDTVEILGASLFALTLKCARCHDHKFDPVSQEDYYRLMACLTPAYNSQNWRAVIPYAKEVKDRSLADVSEAELAAIARHNEPLDREIDELKRERAMLEEQRKKDAGASGLEAPTAEIDRKVAALSARRRACGKIQALWDLGPPPPTHILIRGELNAPGAEVAPGFLRTLSAADDEQLFNAPPPRPDTSGRRTALARWATQPGSRAAALLARVMVNRLWQHLFGEGLVATTGNFGIQGEPPTHPELLEWLCAELVRQGWRIKPLIRCLVTSAAYRQASRREDSERALEIDPRNRLLWRMRLRQLDAEVIRDSLLAVGGALDAAMGGPPIGSVSNPDGRVTVADPSSSGPRRRSIYLLVRRSYNLSLLSVFDQPAIGTSCAAREPSAVVSQSLTMLNDAFLFEQAERFAARALAAAEPSRRAQAETAFRMALARKPNPSELAWCGEFVAQQAATSGASGGEAERAALAQLCHMLLNTSEFLYAE